MWWKQFNKLFYLLGSNEKKKTIIDDVLSSQVIRIRFEKWKKKIIIEFIGKELMIRVQWIIFEKRK